MGYCNKCSCYNCNCITQQTNLISDQAGRDGLSAKDIAILTGKFAGGTDAQFVEWNKGEKGDPGKDGAQIWTGNTEW